MKTTKCLKKIIICSLIFSSGTSFAFNVGGTRSECTPPHFRSFTPPERVGKGPVPEVEAESEIGFTVSSTANPESIVVTIKRQKVDFEVIDKNSFFQVKAKLPAAFNGKFARIDMYAKSVDGECKNKDGWLIKVKKPAEVVAETPALKAVPEEPTPEKEVNPEAMKVE